MQVNVIKNSSKLLLSNQVQVQPHQSKDSISLMLSNGILDVLRQHLHQKATMRAIQKQRRNSLRGDL